MTGQELIEVAKTRKSKLAATSAKPVCIAMLICERVIEEEAVVSAIRIVDTITMPPPAAPIGASVDLARLNLILMLKNGDVRRKHEISIWCRGPSRDRTLVVNATPDFKGGPETGNNLVAPVRLIWEGAGLYWLEASFDKKFLAKTPIKIAFDKQDKSK